MFKKIKTNPVYEIEKLLVNEKVVVGKMNEMGELDVNEKCMYDTIDFVYKKALEGQKKGKYGWYIVWSAVSLIVGLIAGCVLVLQFLPKQ